MLQPARTPLETLIDALMALAPPRHLVHVGAGEGLGSIHRWRRHAIPHATLVDAEGRRLTWVQSSPDVQPGWRVHEAVVAEVSGPASWHIASNPDESGLIDVPTLTALWPQLRAVGEPVEVDATSLDAVLTHAFHGGDRPAPDWLLIDCLGAEALLRGAAAWLDTLDVVILRWSSSVARLRGWVDDDVTGFMGERGYTRLGTDSTHHPAVAYLTYTRDRSAQARRSEAQCQALTQRLNDLEREATLALEFRTRLLEEQEARTRALGGQIEQMAAECAALRQARHDMEQAHACEVESLRADLARMHAEVGELRDIGALVEADLRGELAQASATAQDQATAFATELATARGQLRDAAAELARLESEIQNLGQERAQSEGVLRAELLQAQAHADALVATHATELADAREQARASTAELVQVRLDATRQAEQASQVAAALAEELARTQAASQANHVAMLAACEKVESSRVAIAALEEQAQERAQVEAVLRLQLEQVQNQATKAAVEAARLEAELRERLEHRARELALAEERACASQAEVADLHLAIGRHQQSAATLEAELLDARAKLEADGADLIRVRGQLEDMAQAHALELAELRGQVQAAEADAARARSEVQHREESAAMAEAALQAQLAALRFEHEQLTDALAAEKRRAQEAQQTIASLEADLARATDQAFDAVAALATSRSAAQQLADTHAVSEATLRAELTAAIALRDEYARDLAESRSTEKAQKAALDLLKDEAAVLAQAQIDMRTQLDDAVRQAAASAEGFARERADAQARRQATDAELGQARQALAVASGELAQLRGEVHRLIQTREQAEAAHKAELSLAQERANSLVAESTALAQAKAALAAERDALLGQVAAARQEHESLQQQLMARRSENDELAMRQNLMQEELLKAEAQIELIKDLLLREPGV